MSSQCEQLKEEYEILETLKKEFDSAVEEVKEIMAKETKTPEETEELNKAFQKAHQLKAEFERQRNALQEKLWLFENLSQKELQEQYAAYENIFQKNGIVERLPSGKLGVEGIDGVKYPMPELKDIIQEVRRNKEKFRIKFEQGLIKMQMTPIAMSLGKHIEKYKQVLLKHYKQGKLLATKEKSTDPDEPLELNENQPVWVWDGYKDADINGTLVYFPKEFSTTNHQGKTKQQLIEETKDTLFPGWLVIFREKLPNIPRQGKGKEIKGRKQLEAGQTPNQYLEMLKTNSQYQNETGMTPEEQIIYSIKHLEQTNQVIDDYSGKGSASLQLGAFFTTDDSVPYACWYRVDRQSYLDRGGPEGSDSGIGVRTALRLR